MFGKAPRANSIGTEALSWAFAIIAGGASAAGAYQMSEIAKLPLPALGVLIALSLLAVTYERTAISRIQARRARNDHRAARWGIIILCLGALYTGFMQLTYFGSIMQGPMAADDLRDADIAGVQRAINDLETRRTWVPQPQATAKALESVIDALERDKAKGEAFGATPLQRAAAAKAQEALPGKRAELASAEAYEQLSREIAGERGKLAQLKGKPASDIKAAMLKAVIGERSHLFTYALVLFCVLFIQLAQIMLPAVAGRAEIDAARAKAAVIVESPAVPLVIEGTLTPPGPLTQAAAARRDEKAARTKRLPAPAAPAQQKRIGGLAGKLSQ